MSEERINKNSKRKNRNKKKKMATWKKVCIGIVSFLLILVLVAVIGVNYYFGKMNNVKLDNNNLSINTQLDKYKDIKNIALFGVDAPDGGAGRSDSIMILTIDENSKSIKVSSIIRDSYVTIPGRPGKDKINHAYAFGGPELAIKTLNENFKLNIADFVSVDFSSLPELINMVGGVNIDITKDDLGAINGIIDSLNIELKTKSPNLSRIGNQLLDGTQALAYSRIRYATGGDFERSHRQRLVLSSLFSKFTTLSVGDYPSVVNKLLPLVETSMGATDIISLAMTVGGFSNSDLIQNRFPTDEDGSGQTINSVYYFVFDEDKTVNKMHEFIFGK